MIWLLLVLVVVGAAVLAAWWLPERVYGTRPADAGPDARLAAIAGLRTAIVAGVAGLAAVFGLAINARSVGVAREALLASQEAQAAALRVQERGQVTERFTRAIEHLGAHDPQRVTVRIGCVYALDRIAVDSPADQPAVFDVLHAFVRETPKIAWSRLDPGPHDQPEPEPWELEESLTPPPADVRAALTVLVRLRHPVTTRAEDGAVRSLAPVDWSNLRLDLMDLSGADLSGSVLSGSSLRGANLRETDLSEARLIRTNLAVARLRGADLTGAVLSGAILWNARLNAETPDEPRTRLPGADLSDATVDSARLDFADLSGANLTRASLLGTCLRRADLSGACLADVRSLRGCDLTYAVLNGADLRGANLSRVEGLTQQQVDRAVGDLRTQLPDRIIRPAAWSATGSG